MNISNFLEFIRQFFLDFIGNVIPGLLLTLGCFYLFFPSDSPLSILEILSGNSFYILLLLVLSFVLGHFISELGVKIVANIVPFFSRLSDSFISHDDLIKDISNSANFKNFIQLYRENFGDFLKEEDMKDNVHYWRNIALSIAPEGNQLVYKFRFLNLFNLGIGTVLWLLSFLWITLLPINKFLVKSNFISSPFILEKEYTFVLIIISILILISIPFLTRSFSFHRRTMTVPFGIALNKLNSMYEKKNVEGKDKLKEIYLAGGFRSGWQDEVIKEVNNKFRIVDPRKNNLDKPKEYTLWDLQNIKEADIIFAFIENQNPGLYSLSLEIGYAKANNKFIILVDEKSKGDEQAKKYLSMVRETSNIVFDNFEEGLQYLDNLKLEED